MLSRIAIANQRREKYTFADFVAHAGIPTYIDDGHAIAHNKNMIIDRSTLITGSSSATTHRPSRSRSSGKMLTDTILTTDQIDL